MAFPPSFSITSLPVLPLLSDGPALSLFSHLSALPGLYFPTHVVPRALEPAVAPRRDFSRRPHVGGVCQRELSSPGGRSGREGGFCCDVSCLAAAWSAAAQRGHPCNRPRMAQDGFLGGHGRARDLRWCFLVLCSGRDLLAKTRGLGGRASHPRGCPQAGCCQTARSSSLR